MWDGSSPHVEFPRYERGMKLWCTETEDKKKGVRLVRSLGGSARAIVDSLNFEELVCKSGMENITKVLSEYNKPHLEVSLARALEGLSTLAAVGEKGLLGLPNTDKLSPYQAHPGAKLPSEARGYIHSGRPDLQKDKSICFPPRPRTSLTTIALLGPFGSSTRF